MQTLRANGIDQSYDWHGSAPGVPLALVAGMGGASSYWAPQLPAFSAHHRTLVYDQRGTGRTTRVGVESIEQLAADFIALLDALKIERVHLIGHSTGGAIGQLVGARHPERVASLVLYASINRSDAYRRRIWSLRKRILEELGPEAYAQTTSLFFYPPQYISENDAALARIEAKTVAEDIGSPAIMASRIGAILKFDIGAELDRIKAPTLVVCAEDDQLTPAYFSREIAAAIAGAELAMFERGGHALSRYDSGAFNARVLAFLEQRK
jgi:aminoacrylate hydrolase